MLNWASRFGILVFLDNNHYQNAYNRYEWLLAVKPIHIISGNKGDLLSDLYQWHAQHSGWLFGHIAYNFKNLLEPKLAQKGAKEMDFPPFHFFCPEIICYLCPDKKNLIIESNGMAPEIVWAEILQTETDFEKPLPEIRFELKLNKEEYLRKIQSIRNHIREGDCYELN